MCLSIPMQLLEIQDSIGTVDVQGVKRDVDISLVQPIQIGDYVLIHAGFALSKIDTNEALRTIEFFKEMTEIVDNG
jgi:hydrogenase expression/formation protein HypC